MTARRRVTLTLLLLALTNGCAAPAGGVSATGNTVSVGGTAPSVPLPPGVTWPATGALFGGPPDRLGDHYCTASVVDTAPGDIVLTAAHCVADGDGTPPRTGISFIPGYHDHTAPFGVWTVSSVGIDDAWRDHADIDHDVAFLTVTRPDAPPIEHVVGGYHLVINAGSSNTVVALGYPDFADTATERSGITIRHSPTQLELDAHGLYDGTSGGPWLRAGTDGDIIAVTGGYQRGGLDPDISYAAYLDSAAADLFRQAGGTP